MKKKLFLSVLTATMLASCVSDDGLGQKVGEEGGKADDGPAAVNFNAYAARGVTRSGTAGVLDLAALKTSGFGVFAYYTNQAYYDQTYIPNFMYNQHVTYNSTVDRWDYTPVMYWPNEYGADAGSADQDKVTFFAYAPYVTASPAGNVADYENGITGLSGNTATGDPIVKFVSTFDASKSVDLCWGVCDVASWDKIQGGTQQAMTIGMPWLNVEHPAGTSQRMNFRFNHALAQLNVQIDADPDTETHNTSSAIDAESKVYVRSISFSGIALKGALNLNNKLSNTARWLDYGGTTSLPIDEEVTIYDGRPNGGEGSAASDAEESPVGLNPNIIQTNSTTTGVTSQLQNLLKPKSSDPAVALTEPIFVIPTGQVMNVTIVYDVETKSPNVAGYLSDGVTHGVSVENRITKTIDFGGGGLMSGKKYTLLLHLGMNSVKFSASIGDWEYSTPTETDGWLPGNTGTPGVFGLSKTAVTVGTQSTTTVLATNVPEGETISWTTSDENIASLSAPAGTRAASYTGPSVLITTGTTEGTATVTATSSVSHQTATCLVTVTSDAPNTTVSLDKTSLSLHPTGQGTYTALLTATTTNPTGAAVVWSSTDDEVATVTNGQVIAHSAGTATVSASVNGGATATCTVSVTSISLNKSSTTLYVGGTEQLTATRAPNASELATWESSNTGAATVSNTGLITAVATGTTTITATSASGATATCTVTVNNKPAATVTTLPAAVENLVYSGSEKTLITAGTPSGGTMQYALGTASSVTGDWSATLPKGTNAGTYYVWYKAVGDASHTDSSPAYVTASIGKADATKTDPTAKTGLQYTGSAQALVTGGTSSQGTYTYTKTSGGSYTETIPTGTNAGSYTVYWKFTGDANHKDASGTISDITIGKVPATLTLNNTTAVSFTTSDNNGATNTGKKVTGKTGTASVTVTSANTNACTASYDSSTNVITVTRVSIAAFTDVTITVSATADDNHTAPSNVTFKVSAEDYTAGASVKVETVGGWDNTGTVEDDLEADKNKL